MSDGEDHLLNQIAGAIGNKCFAANETRRTKKRRAENWCDNCGLCCMHMRTPPFIGPSDPRWKALPQKLRDEIHKWVMDDDPRFILMVQNDGMINPCLWLDLVSGKCRHYELRPDVCREYEVGCGACRSVRQSVGLTVKGMPRGAE